MKNSNFKALVAKMDALKETEQGKLKGGVRSLSSTKSTVLAGNNTGCGTNVYQCGIKASPSSPGSVRG